jgi:heat shock protein 4
MNLGVRIDNCFVLFHQQSVIRGITNLFKQAMDTDANGESKPKTRKVKKQVRKGDLGISSGTPSCDTATMQLLAERENAMVMEDKLVADTEDKKNELESRIYELRDKIDGLYSEYASEGEKTKLKAKLDETEVRSTPPLFPPFLKHTH